jgi:hypothetical protein
MPTKILGLFLVFWLMGCSKDSGNDLPAPLLITDFTISIPENPLAGAAIGTVNTNGDGPFQFSIQQQTPIGAVSIDAATGTLYVANAALFDYETVQSIIGRIKVTQGNNTDTADFQINLLDVEEGLVYEGDVQLNYQEDVDAFGAFHYTEITGQLLIFDGSFPNTPITDLSPLQDLKHIGKALQIFNVQGITSLHGLENLETVAIDINVNSNDQLADITALSQITETRFIRIARLDALYNLHGLENLTAVESLTIYEMDHLLNLNELSGLTTVHNDLNIYGNIALTSLEGLSNLQGPVQTINILYNPVLTSLNGLESIGPVLNDALVLGANSSLTDLSALSHLTEISSLSLSDNTQLTSLQDLSGLQQITGTIRLSGNTTLSDLGIFCQVNLTELQQVVIENNPVLQDLSCFQSLTTLQGSLFIGNNGIQNLAGFESLISIAGDLILINNDHLTDLCALTPLAQNEGIGGEYIVSSNGYNPSLQDLLNGDCSL